MSDETIDLLPVHVRSEPFGGAWRALLLALRVMLLSIGVSVLLSAVLMGYRPEAPWAPRIAAALTPWQSERWHDAAISAETPGEVMAALATRLRLSPTSADDWVQLARLRLRPPVDGERLRLGKLALRQAFDVAPLAAGLERLRLGLATLAPDDEGLDIAVERDLARLLTESAAPAAFLADARQYASPAGLALIEAAAGKIRSAKR